MFCQISDESALISNFLRNGRVRVNALFEWELGSYSKYVFLRNHNNEFSREITKIVIYVLQRKSDHKKIFQKASKYGDTALFRSLHLKFHNPIAWWLKNSDFRNFNNFQNLVEIMYKNLISVWVFRKGRLTDNHQKDNNLIFST